MRLSCNQAAAGGLSSALLTSSGLGLARLGSRAPVPAPQVRYTAAVAVRRLLTTVPEHRDRLLPPLIGPMCLNRCGARPAAPARCPSGAPSASAASGGLGPHGACWASPGVLPPLSAWGPGLPPGCRYYVADGVRAYSQETWRLVMGSEGRALVAQCIAPLVDYYLQQTKGSSHAAREAACACIAGRQAAPPPHPPSSPATPQPVLVQPLPLRQTRGAACAA
jgi:hypothetical protein